MNPLKVLTTPQYLFRPKQVFVRLWRSLSPSKGGQELVQLPWGSRILIRPDEAVGSNIWYYGILELTVAEAISRLLDESEIALDIGANIGQMTSLMRVIAGPKGRVFSFEPHPELFKELTENAKLSDAASAAAVELFDVALSSENGSAMLDQGEDWNTNRGVARVLSPTESQQARSFKIQLRALDSILPPDTKVGLCKLDVERHELQVLSGALGLLRRRQIRDVLFEDFGPYPGEAQQLLQSYGFSIFSLHLTLLKPEIRPLAPGTTFRRPYEGCDFIATLDPERTKKRFASFGWTALKARH